MKDVYLIYPCLQLSNHPLFRHALFELQHVKDDSKVYMNINEDNSERIYNDSGDKYYNVITQD